MWREASESYGKAALHSSIHGGGGPKSIKSKNVFIISYGKLKGDKRYSVMIVFDLMYLHTNSTTASPSYVCIA